MNHPSWNGFLGYFRAADFDRDTATGASELWTDDFDAIEVFNGTDFEQNRDGSVADWFALLGFGETLGGSNRSSNSLETRL